MIKKAHIIWSPLAEESYLKILEYIITKWNKKEALKFDAFVKELISKIASYKHICP
jgi:plasmid stabilization system protein ParE